MVIALSGEKLLYLLTLVFCFCLTATCGAVWIVSGFAWPSVKFLIHKAPHEGMLITITGFNLKTPPLMFQSTRLAECNNLLNQGFQRTDLTNFDLACRKPQGPDC